jgi:hypothetical protein
MPTASISWPVTNGKRVNRTVAPRRVILSQNGGSEISISFPFGPTKVDFQNLGISYQEISRPQAKPILVGESDQLRTVSFTALIADKDTGGKISVQGMLNDLETMASEDVDCSFKYGLAALDYSVRITQLSYSSAYRNIDGNIVRASLSVQLTERVQVNQEVTALTAVTKTPDPIPAAPAGDAPADPLDDDTLEIAGCYLYDVNPQCAIAIQLREDLYNASDESQASYWADLV